MFMKKFVILNYRKFRSLNKLLKVLPRTCVWLNPILRMNCTIDSINKIIFQNNEEAVVNDHRFFWIKCSFYFVNYLLTWNIFFLIAMYLFILLLLHTHIIDWRQEKTCDGFINNIIRIKEKNDSLDHYIIPNYTDVAFQNAFHVSLLIYQDY